MTAFGPKPPRSPADIARTMRLRVAIATGLAIPGLPLAAIADDTNAPTEKAAKPDQARPRQAKLVSFANHSSERARIVASSGFKLAPLGSLQKPGLRAMLLTAMSLREREPGSITTSRMLGARGLVGHEWHVPKGAFSIYAGVSASIFDRRTAVITRRQAQFGPVALVEYWHNWQQPGSESTGATQATFLVDLAERSAYARLRHGFALQWPGVMLGPETSLSVGFRQMENAAVLREGWHKARLGLHLSGIRVFRMEIGLAGGYELTIGARNGGYAALSTLMTF